VFELICAISDKTKQRDLTKHYAISYLDVLLTDSIPEFLGPTNPKNEAILAPICILLASKFDEIDENIP
jgi:hypothetical protein